MGRERVVSNKTSQIYKLDFSKGSASSCMSEWSDSDDEAEAQKKFWPAWFSVLKAKEMGITGWGIVLAG